MITTTHRPRYQAGIFDRCASLGVDHRIADALADAITDPAHARRVHALLDVLIDANAMALALLLVTRGFDSARAGSLLRASGHAEGTPLAPAQVDAIRDSLTNPYRLSTRAAPSLYMQRTYRHG